MTSFSYISFDVKHPVVCSFDSSAHTFSFLLSDTCRSEPWPKPGAKYFIDKDVLEDLEERNIMKESTSAITEDDCFKDCKVQLDDGMLFGI